MPKYRCDNCDFETDDEDDMDGFSHFWERVEPGNEMPAGDCPKCGTFCYVVKQNEEKLLSRIHRLAEGGKWDQDLTCDYIITDQALIPFFYTCRRNNSAPQIYPNVFHTLPKRLTVEGT